MKICVYAIAKNESKFIDRWYNSVKEADYVCVLDTGSTDDTFEKLKSKNILTKQVKYKNFRFDTARNDSLKLIPPDTDICVCVDLDEVFNLGWSKILKDYWKENTTQARYRYTWNFNPDGTEGYVFMADKIHKNNLFKWTHPVHEVLKPTCNFKNNTIDIPQIQLNHYPDNLKSRSSYLPLLELSVKEDPNNDRNLHYLGREYMFNKEYDKAISTFKKHLSLPTSNWKEERCASLRFIANCYRLKGNSSNQEEYLLRAILEHNQSREPYFDLGVFYFNQKKYLLSAVIFNEMLKIKNRELNYISAPHCWNSLPYDYLSLCYYYLNDLNLAIKNIKSAINFDKNNKRLLNNLNIFLNKNSNFLKEN